MPDLHRVSQTSTERVAVDGTIIDTFLGETTHANERELLFAATRSIVALLGDRGSCVLLEGEPRVTLSTACPDLVDWAINLGRYPEIERAVSHRTVVAIDDAHEDARLERVRSLLPPHLHSIVVVPLVCADRCLGVLIAQSMRPRRAGAEALATAALLAKITARLLPPAPLPTPATQVLSARRLRVDETRPNGVRKPRRVLVIDDDQDSAAALSEVLLREGFGTLTAHDGESGVRLAREERPDLILLDMCMPHLDGVETAAILSNDLLTRNIPILFLSGSQDLAMRVRNLPVREMDFLSKPFGREELMARIERALSHVEMHQRVRIEANSDELTGLGNLRSLRERLAIEQSRWERYGTPVSVLTIDVDKLKQLNDMHGHAAGSKAIAAIAGVLGHDIRETDLAARYGGDEFVVVLPHATLQEATLFADRAIGHIRALYVDGVKVTVSIGVASLEDEPGETVQTLLERSDAAAYRAKRQGGDQVCRHEPGLGRSKPNQNSSPITQKSLT